MERTAKRRLSNKEMHWIAQERIWRLLTQAEAQALAGQMQRSKRYLQLARAISMRTKTPLPKDFLYCRKCLTPLIPGKNCRVRLRSSRVVVHCLECDSIRRKPYLNERRNRSGEKDQEGA